MIPPRRLTHEHEAAHVVVARLFGASIVSVDLSLAPTAKGVSLGRAEWKPPQGGGDTILAGFIAGPVQTRITIERVGLSSTYADAALEQEARDIEAYLAARGIQTKDGAARGLINFHFSRIRSYMETAPVQAAIQLIADALESCERAGRSFVPWSELDVLVDWDSMPPRPTLDQPPR